MPAAKTKPAAKPTRSAAAKPTKAKPAPAKAKAKPAKSAKAKPKKIAAEAKPKKTKAPPEMKLLARPLSAAPSGARCWLIKSEPDVFSIDALARVPQEPWNGVRNYQSRNHMRDHMQVGDPVLFYHSNADPPAIVGLARVASAPYPDPTQFDPNSSYHDDKATREVPRWFMVDFAFVEKFPAAVSLETLRTDPTLDGIYVARKAHRPSIQPVEPWHFLRVAELGRSSAAMSLLEAKP